MLAALDAILRTTAVDLLTDGATPWHTLHVTYEHPHVERVWFQVDPDHRLLFHRIQPCLGRTADEVALWHPHPWPSAVRVFRGGYRMRVGSEAHVLATLDLTPGSGYEMIHPQGWHAVEPHSVNFSAMLIGRPWDPPPPGLKGTTAKHEALSDEARGRILAYFHERLVMHRDPGGLYDR